MASNNVAGTVTPSGRRYRNFRLTPLETRAYRARIYALGWSQNYAAKRLGLTTGLFSRWITADYGSRPIRRRLEALLRREERKRGPRTAPDLAAVRALRAAGSAVARRRRQAS